MKLPRSVSPLTLRLLLGGLLLAAAPGWAEVAGRVVNSQGAPVEAAQVDHLDSEASVLTGASGGFRLPIEPPVRLRVRHPRYETLEVEVPGGTPEPLRLELRPKQEIYEEVVVSASRGEAAPPVSIAATLVHPEDAPAPSGTLVQMVATVPGVSENGQGGIFQTYSVRGISRQRVLTLVSGMRIVSERRAGAAVGFVDPLLMRSVEVLRGPSSSYYGSGALGGVVQLFPRSFEGVSAVAGYTAAEAESYQAVGWGGGGWSLGVAHRGAGDAEAPNGRSLPSGFDQYSAIAEREWQRGGFDFSVTAIGSAGRDIGKPNTDFPVRTTIYPGEEHLLVRFALRAPRNWRFEAWVHPNELETRVVESDRNRSSRLENRAFDFGLNWQRELEPRKGLSSRIGVDYYGRRGVDADELLVPLDGRGPEVVQSTLDGGEQDEAGLYGAVEWGVGRATVLTGGRVAWQRQTNAGGPSEQESAWTGFAGLVAPLGQGWELAANLGSGLRFASLSERFFSGVTGRGDVIGNPGLDAERSLGADLGLRWYGESLFVSASLFRTEIDDYIERVEVAPDRLSFVNLTSGTVEGLELEGTWTPAAGWSVSFGAHRMVGRDDAGQPLADIPADRLHAGLAWRRGRWGIGGRWEHRVAKDDPGSGEKPIPAAEVVSASLSWQWSDDLRLTASVRNLLDEAYFNSADDKVDLAVERSIGLGLSWRWE